jgi:hypothetical protein
MARRVRQETIVERWFVNRHGETRVDVWCAIVVSLMLSYLSSAIVLLNLLGLRGWD